MNKENNFLDYIPVHAIDWEKNDRGKVTLIRERTKNRFLKKLISLLNRSQFFRLNLDELGTAVWLSIDGKHSVGDIAELMKTRFGDSFEQPEQRVSHYMGMLKRNQFIDLKRP